MPVFTFLRAFYPLQQTGSCRLQTVASTSFQIKQLRAIMYMSLLLLQTHAKVAYDLNRIRRSPGCLSFKIFATCGFRNSYCVDFRRNTTASETCRGVSSAGAAVVCRGTTVSNVVVSVTAFWQILLRKCDGRQVLYATSAGWTLCLDLRAADDVNEAL